MQQRIHRGMSFMAVAVLLGVYLAQAQNQGSIQANFAPLFPQKKVDARSTPAKVTSEEDYALTSKGYVLIGWVSASQPGKKTDAAVTKQLESAILQKAAEAGGDVVRLLKEGALENTWVPTGKTKTKRDCLDSHTVTVSTGQQCTHSCYTDSHGFQHCNDVGCAPSSTTRTQCVKWGEPEIVPITRKEEGLVSVAAVWRYDSEHASLVMGTHSNITNAALAGDLNRVQALLKDHPELISSKDASGDTPLHSAIRVKAGKNLVDLLLAGNPDVNARDADGETPLHLAAVSGDQSLVQQLLDHKADINARKNSGETILLLTACQGNLQMAEFLLANKADVNVRDTGGNTPLLCAAIGGHPEMVRVLLAHKADVNAGNLKGYTPLAFIKSFTKLKTKQFKEIAEILRQAGGGMVPDTGVKEIAEASAMPVQSGAGQVQSAGQTETHETAELPPESAGSTSQSSKQTGAAVDCDTDMKMLQLALSIDPKQALFEDEDSGQTPLHSAAANGCKAEVELLLAKNAEVNAKDHDGFTPLHLAASADVAGLLLAKGAEVNARSSKGRTALHNAAEDGHKDVAELLLAKGADVNAMNQDGYTPLFMAVVGGHKEVAELLLAKGAEVNARDHDRFAPLHWAASEGHADVAELLLANGADVNPKDKHGHAPLFWAYYKGHKDVALLLVQHGGHK